MAYFAPQDPIFGGDAVPIGMVGDDRMRYREPAMAWGARTLPGYLNGLGDIYSIFEPGAAQKFGQANVLADGHPDPENAYGFTDFNLDQLKQYMERSTAPGQTFGTGYESGTYNNNLNADWKLVDQGGQPFVEWTGAKIDKGGGFLDRIAAGLPGIGLALMGAGGAFSGFGGAAEGLGGAAGGFDAGLFNAAPGGAGALGSGGLGEALALGGIDSSWGVNPLGGNVDFGAENFFGFEENPWGQLRDVSIGGNGLTGIPNLQDLMVKIDALPPGTGTIARNALGRVFAGQGTAADYASLLGTLGSTALGVLGANKQANSLTDIANQSRADRAPFLNLATGWANNPSSYYASEPAQAAMKGVLAGLAVNGNPANNPTAMASATEAGLRNWQNAVTGFGNLGLSGQDSRNALLSQAATADRGITASLASGLGSLTQPDNSLESMLRRLQATGIA